MTLKQHRSNASRNGGVILATIILTMIGATMVGSYVTLSINDARITRYEIDRQKAEIAAEAGLEYGIARLKDTIFWYRFMPSVDTNALQTLLNNINPPDPMGDYAYLTPDGESAFRIRVESDIEYGPITQGSAFRGVNGTVQYFSITSGAINTNSGIGVVFRQEVQAIGMALIRFGVFYERDLEIQPGAAMVFEGPVHSNADIYMGGSSRFHDRITARGNVIHRRKNDGSRNGEARIADGAGTLRSMRLGDGSWLDGDNINWMVQSVQRWNGNIQSTAHGVSRLSPPINPVDDPYALIQRPLATNDVDYSPLTEREKFVNRAALRIHVDSNGVFSATDFHTNDVTAAFLPATLETDAAAEPVKDGNGMYVMAVTGAYEVVDARFRDNREDRWVYPVEIYVDRLIESFPELYDNYSDDEGRGVVYITRDTPHDNALPAVRLRNGREIDSAIGLSVISDLPVYIEGHYNHVDTKPAMVAGDGVNMLSRAWRDSNSTGGQNDRLAENTDYNTVVMTGIGDTTWGNYNGGLENVLRFLEHWSGRTVTYRGSIICLWRSRVADGAWHFGSHGGTFRYTAPNRNWGYDNIYRTQSPPGMTHVFGMEETAWLRTNWEAEGW